MAPATARPAKQVYPLVCTVSTNFHRSDSLPRDGLCGYLFYDSLYKSGSSSLAGPLSTDVEAFAARARRHNFTEFGMSLSLETIFKPHLFISMAHISYRDAERPDCMILPSSVHHYPPGVTPTYGHTMNDSLALLRYLEDQQVFVSMAVGVTMKGRVYKPRNFSYPQSYNVFKSCMAHSGTQDFTPADGCPHGFPGGLAANYEYNSTFFAEYAYDRSIEIVMVFDGKKGIKEKLCDLKQHYLSLSYGIAAYDVDFDSNRHSCEWFGIDGPYNRIDFLKRLRDFIALNYTGAASKARCDQVS
ncbi:hypothetical protein MTO96_002162 [Rhipicephalus appendiculatus]